MFLYSHPPLHPNVFLPPPSLFICTMLQLVFYRPSSVYLLLLLFWIYPPLFLLCRTIPLIFFFTHI
ncbi:hypothetical protein K492DRAFT_85393 [Lichtheimia hyalospora FSU 10163]|nr:hypothetical protein K492DRAFT_85393 [Lichtheimia hyalospora FSU 10163]